MSPVAVATAAPVVHVPLHRFSETCVCERCSHQRATRAIAEQRAAALEVLDQANGRARGQHSKWIRTGDVVTAAHDTGSRYVVTVHPNRAYTLHRERPKVRGKRAVKAHKRARRDARRLENRLFQESARA